jgi:hypothetical protein
VQSSRVREENGYRNGTNIWLVHLQNVELDGYQWVRVQTSGAVDYVAVREREGEGDDDRVAT